MPTLKAAFATALLTLALACCGKPGPEAVATTFFTAMRDHDEKTLLANLDPAEVAQLSGGLHKDMITPVTRHEVTMSVRALQQTDTTATLMMTGVDPAKGPNASPVTFPVTMKKIDGTWFVQLIPGH